MLIGLGIVVVALAAVLALVWFERSSHDWGASAEEVAMPLTGDIRFHDGLFRREPAEENDFD